MRRWVLKGLEGWVQAAEAKEGRGREDYREIKPETEKVIIPTPLCGKGDRYSKKRRSKRA